MLCPSFPPACLNVRCPLTPDIVAKVFLGWRTKILRAADAFSARRREGPYRFIQNRSRTSVVALKSHAAVEKSKDQLREIFRVARFSTFATISATNGLMHCNIQDRDSITSSAAASSEGGIVRPSAFALLRSPRIWLVARPAGRQVSLPSCSAEGRFGLIASVCPWTSDVRSTRVSRLFQSRSGLRVRTKVRSPAWPLPPPMEVSGGAGQASL